MGLVTLPILLLYSTLSIHIVLARYGRTLSNVEIFAISLLLAFLTYRSVRSVVAMYTVSRRRGGGSFRPCFTSNERNEKMIVAHIFATMGLVLGRFEGARAVFSVPRGIR